MELWRTGAPVTDETGGVTVIDHHHRVVPVRQITDFRQVGNDAVHGKNTVCHDQTSTAIGRGDQLPFKIRHVIVGVAQALRLAQPHPVDDRGVVQGIGNDGIFRSEQRLEDPAIGIETGWKDDGVLRAKVVGNADLEIAMQILGSAYEADRGHAESMTVEGLFRCFNQSLVVGQPR